MLVLCRTLGATQSDLFAGSEHTDPHNIGLSFSGPSKKRRQRSAHREMQANRPSSPYNGYSTDSSAVFVPRKPYQKSQRRKRPGNKGSKFITVIAVRILCDVLYVVQSKGWIRVSLFRKIILLHIALGTETL